VESETKGRAEEDVLKDGAIRCGLIQDGQTRIKTRSAPKTIAAMRQHEENPITKLPKGSFHGAPAFFRNKETDTTRGKKGDEASKLPRLDARCAESVEATPRGASEGVEKGRPKKREKLTERPITRSKWGGGEAMSDYWKRPWAGLEPKSKGGRRGEEAACKKKCRMENRPD